jgi:hypothetical protein
LNLGEHVPRSDDTVACWFLTGLANGGCGLDVSDCMVSLSFLRDRLTALLGMLEINHDGEVVNAGRLAKRLI